MTALSRVAWATALALSIAAAAPAEPLQPAQQPHFVWAKDGEVVLQIVGHGPSATTWSHR